MIVQIRSVSSLRLVWIGRQRDRFPGIFVYVRDTLFERRLHSIEKSLQTNLSPLQMALAPPVRVPPAGIRSAVGWARILSNLECPHHAVKPEHIVAKTL